MKNDFRQTRVKRINQFVEIIFYIFVGISFGHAAKVIEVGQVVIAQHSNHFLVHRVTFGTVKSRYFRIGQVDGIGRDFIFFGHF